MATASIHRSIVPPQRKLNEDETEVDFEIWKQSMDFHICLDARSARFTSSGDLNRWTNATLRGFKDDGVVA